MQLLVSVKNIQEAQLAVSAGVDVIDLKDPEVGALGALDLAVSADIVRLVSGQAIVSATVGEAHDSISSLCEHVQTRVDVGVNIVKIAVDDLFYQDNFIIEIQKLTSLGTKIVAVFFADDLVDIGLFAMLRRAGFYGVMLDTQNKQQSLLDVQTKNRIKDFTEQATELGLICGVAGSIKIQDIDYLAGMEPTFIGMRGGVCENNMRKSNLSSESLQKAKNMLLKHNIGAAERLKNQSFALHS